MAWFSRPWRPAADRWAPAPAPPAAYSPRTPWDWWSPPRRLEADLPRTRPGAGLDTHLDAHHFRNLRVQLLLTEIGEKVLQMRQFPQAHPVYPVQQRVAGHLDRLFPAPARHSPRRTCPFQQPARPSRFGSFVPPAACRAPGPSAAQSPYVRRRSGSESDGSTPPQSPGFRRPTRTRPRSRPSDSGPGNDFQRRARLPAGRVQVADVRLTFRLLAQSPAGARNAAATTTTRTHVRIVQFLVCSDEFAQTAAARRPVSSSGKTRSSRPRGFGGGPSGSIEQFIHGPDEVSGYTGRSATSSPPCVGDAKHPPSLDPPPATTEQNTRRNAGGRRSTERPTHLWTSPKLPAPPHDRTVQQAPV